MASFKIYHDKNRNKLYIKAVFSDRQIRFSIPIVVHKKNWDQKHQKLIDLEQSDIRIDNLLELQDKFNILLNLRKLSPEDLKIAWKDVLLEMKGEIGIIKYTPKAKPFTEFVEEYCVLYDKKSNETLRKIRGINKNWFKPYFKKTYLKDLDRILVQKYLNTLHGKLANNTIRDHVKIIKQVVSEAKAQGHKVPLNEREIPKPTAEEAPVNWLTLDELKILQQVQANTKTEELIRDGFIFRALVGCRFSELHSMKSTNIVDGKIHFREQKSKKEKGSEIPPAAIKLLEKYGGSFPYYANQTENDLIKILLQKAAIKRSVKAAIVIDKKHTVGVFPLHQCISSHDARRTFCRLNYEGGKSIDEIMILIGHSSTDITRRYIGITINEASKLTSEFSAF